MKTIQSLEPEVINRLPEGKMRYRFTNDYLFKLVLQKSNKALKGLIAALIQIPESEIISCEIMNPIMLGDAIEEKFCVLDIRIILNNNVWINIEIQVGNVANWKPRSLFYLSKMYSELEIGNSYELLKPCIHIGILTQSPDKNHKNFYSEYLMADTESGHIYSSDFSLRVLDLSQINNATEEERKKPLYKWAQLFLAEEWEDVKMLVEESKSIEEAVETIIKLTADQKVRMQLDARLKYEHDRANMISAYEKAKSEYESTKDKLVNTEGKLEDIEGKLEDTKGKLEDTKGKLEDTKGKLEDTKGKLENTKGKLEDTEGKLENTKGKLEDTKGKLEDTEGKLEDTKGKLENTQSELENTKEALEKALKELEALQNKK